MKYKNVIIEVKNKDSIELQKYLFRHKYKWFDCGYDFKYFSSDKFYITIRNDRTMSYHLYSAEIYLFNTNFNKLKYPNFVRCEKLKRIAK